MTREQPTSLIKFADAETTYKILSSCTLRWSAPILFNDPFELDHNSSLDFTNDDLLKAAISKTIAMIFAHNDPYGVPNNPFTKAVRRWRQTERFSTEEEAHAVLKELLSTMVDQREATIDEILNDWRSLCRRTRMACFVSKHVDLNLWDRYGDKHCGAAIRFKVDEETTFNNAVPVTYQTERQAITSKKEQLDNLLGLIATVPQETFTEKQAVRPKAYSPEREWRIIKVLDQEKMNPETGEPIWYEDCPFKTSDITAIYLGTKMDEANKEKILNLLRDKYLHIKAYQAKPMTEEYELNFERINFKTNGKAEPKTIAGR